MQATAHHRDQDCPLIGHQFESSSIRCSCQYWGNVNIDLELGPGPGCHRGVLTHLELNTTEEQNIFFIRSTNNFLNPKNLPQSLSLSPPSIITLNKK